MGRCTDPECDTEYPEEMCEDGDFPCIRTNCNAMVDSTDCQPDEDEDGHYANMLRMLFDGDVPSDAPTLRIDVDALRADHEDYMDGFE